MRIDEAAAWLFVFSWPLFVFAIIFRSSIATSIWCIVLGLSLMGVSASEIERAFSRGECAAEWEFANSLTGALLLGFGIVSLLLRLWL
jgi:hypothetical protein